MNKINKIMAGIVLLVSIFGTTFQVGADVDLSALADDEVILLLDQVQQEVADRHLERTAELMIGNYFGGRDIPVGDYVITKTADASGIVWLRASTDDDNDWPSKLYEFLDDDETGSFFVTIEEGDELYTPYPISLTISSGIQFK